jgi:phosphatidyl-myo-inositol dimannoside synthase
MNGVWNINLDRYTWKSKGNLAVNQGSLEIFSFNEHSRRIVKKVLFVCTGAYETDGGIAAVNRLAIRAIMEKGYSLDIYSLLDRDIPVDPSSPSPVAQVYCRTFMSDKYSFTLAVWWAIFRNSYEYIFADHINIASLLAPFAMIGLCRYIVWLHSFELFPPRPDLEGKLGLHYAWKRLANSNFTREYIGNRFPELSVEVCELGLGPEQYPNSSLQPYPGMVPSTISLYASDGSYLELGSQLILHVGRMVSGERYKGQESLLRAFPMLYQNHTDSQLVLVGQGEDMPRLKGIVQTLPPDMQKHIFFTGYLPDELLNMLYQKCYVFAMPSVGEGFGLVYLEAMIHGKACLGARVDATPYLVHDGVTGILVDDPRAPEQVAKALDWFLSHPEETHRMGRAGYDLVCSNYMFPHFQERFWKAISS